jgi:hypothetical protein
MCFRTHKRRDVSEAREQVDLDGERQHRLSFPLCGVDPEANTSARACDDSIDCLIHLIASACSNLSQAHTVSESSAGR